MTARKASWTPKVVDPNESAPSARLSVAQAAATGDHRKLLVSMRERIAQTVSSSDCPPRDLASLTRRLQDIAREIEALDRRLEQEGREGVSTPDEEFDASAV